MNCTVHGRPRSIYHRVHLKLLWQAKVSVHAAVPTVTAAAAVLMRVPAVLAGANNGNGGGEDAGNEEGDAEPRWL